MKRKMENQQTPKEEKPIQINFVQQLPKEETVKQEIKIEKEPEIIPEPVKAEEVVQPEPEPEIKQTKNNVTVIDRLFPF